jgi:hypothetical protein
MKIVVADPISNNCGKLFINNTKPPYTRMLPFTKEPI